MKTFKTDLIQLASLEGYIACSLVRFDTGECMYKHVSPKETFNIQLTSAYYNELIKLNQKNMKTVNLDNNFSSFTLQTNKHVHIIRAIKNNPFVFIYLLIRKNEIDSGKTFKLLGTIEKKLKL